MISGLKSKPELNGHYGLLETYVAKTRRFGVRFHEEVDATTAVKPANLRLARWWEEEEAGLDFEDEEEKEAEADKHFEMYA